MLVHNSPIAPSHSITATSLPPTVTTDQQTERIDGEQSTESWSPPDEAATNSTAVPPTRSQVLFTWRLSAFLFTIHPAAGGFWFIVLTHLVKIITRNDIALGAALAGTAAFVTQLTRLFGGSVVGSISDT